uniref:Uncharacterized protein n=1 Tax=Myoviridae sp. ctLnO19 TaxID=2825085 RepID=A0A8S5P1E3_9CAUD|nr:MAG TPA: hypothetical protein [Myoviridae sp. ctLnO19]
MKNKATLVLGISQDCRAESLVLTWKQSCRRVQHLSRISFVFLCFSVNIRGYTPYYPIKVVRGIVLLVF